MVGRKRFRVRLDDHLSKLFSKYSTEQQSEMVNRALALLFLNNSGNGNGTVDGASSDDNRASYDNLTSGNNRIRTSDERIRIIERMKKQQTKMLASGSYVQRVTQKRLGQMTYANAPQSEKNALFWSSFLREVESLKLAEQLEKESLDILKEENIDLDKMPIEWRNLAINNGVIQPRPGERVEKYITNEEGGIENVEEDEEEQLPDYQDNVSNKSADDSNFDGGVKIQSIDSISKDMEEKMPIIKRPAFSGRFAEPRERIDGLIKDGENMDEEMLPDAIPPIPFLKKENLGKTPIVFTVHAPPYIKKSDKAGFKDQIVFQARHQDNRIFQVPISLNTPTHEAAVKTWGKQPSKWVGKQCVISVGIVPQGAQRGKPTFDFEFNS